MNSQSSLSGKAEHNSVSSEGGAQHAASPSKRTVLKLSGSFDKSYALRDATEALQAASDAVRALQEAGDCSSAEYFAALKTKKQAEAEHAKAIRNLRNP